MFKPKTQKIELLAKLYPERIKELEGLLCSSTRVYIDYANVRPWADRLGWHVEPVRVKQFFDSFTEVGGIRIYNGTLEGDPRSEKEKKQLAEAFGDGFVTKPVKIMRKSIDISSISLSSTDVLKNFVRQSLLRQLKVETIEYLNSQLAELNKQGIYYIEDRKCNFDVEIGRDMVLDYERKACDCFILWSGDSDFASPIDQLLRDGKRVSVFSTSRKVSSELSGLVPGGLFIFDVKKIKNFICWSREMDGGSPATPV